jgi:hypothetical protein
MVFDNGIGMSKMSFILTARQQKQKYAVAAAAVDAAETSNIDVRNRYTVFSLLSQLISPAY